MIAENQPQPVTLRVSVTDRCQLRCRYCMPAEGVPLVDHRDVLAIEEILEFVGFLRRRVGLSKVRVTGGEPLVRRGVGRLVAGLAAEGVPDVALTTNGFRLPELALSLRQAGLRRVNISLDTLDPATFRRLTRGGDVHQAVAGIEAALRAGIAPVKLNMVVLRGVNEAHVVEVARFGLERGCEVRFLELMPIGVAADRYREWFVGSDETRGRLAEAFGLEPMPAEPGASSRRFWARDDAGADGVVGFISPCTDPFCEGCRRLRLTATGRLLGCLAQADGTDVRSVLRGDGSGRDRRLLEAVDEALAVKRRGRRFADQDLMAGIGG